MRRRVPGFYVSVRLKSSPGSLPSEMLDGPWPDAASAQQRLEEIEAERPGARDLAIVEVGEDGVTLTRSV